MQVLILHLPVQCAIRFWPASDPASTCFSLLLEINYHIVVVSKNIFKNHATVTRRRPQCRQSYSIGFLLGVSVSLPPQIHKDEARHCAFACHLGRCIYAFGPDQPIDTYSASRDQGANRILISLPGTIFKERSRRRLCSYVVIPPYMPQQRAGSGFDHKSCDSSSLFHSGQFLAPLYGSSMCSFFVVARYVPYRLLLSSFRDPKRKAMGNHETKELTSKRQFRSIWTPASCLEYCWGTL